MDSAGCLFIEPLLRSDRYLATAHPSPMKTIHQQSNLETPGNRGHNTRELCVSVSDTSVAAVLPTQQTDLSSDSTPSSIPCYPRKQSITQMKRPPYTPRPAQRDEPVCQVRQVFLAIAVTSRYLALLQHSLLSTYQSTYQRTYQNGSWPLCVFLPTTSKPCLVSTSVATQK